MLRLANYDEVLTRLRAEGRKVYLSDALMAEAKVYIRENAARDLEPESAKVLELETPVPREAVLFPNGDIAYPVGPDFSRKRRNLYQDPHLVVNLGYVPQFARIRLDEFWGAGMSSTVREWPVQFDILPFAFTPAEWEGRRQILVAYLLETLI